MTLNFVYVSKELMIGLFYDHDVRVLQERLNQMGSKIDVDGCFGMVTDQAVRGFQKAHQLAVDGIVGPFTRQALYMKLQTQNVYGGVTPWMNWMNSHIGEMEKTGSKPTPFNIEVFSHTDFGRIETMMAGCAATASTALEETGYLSPHSAAARSFDCYGTPTELKYGAVLTWKWKTGQRHVSFCNQINADGTIVSLGGNQSSRVCDETYSSKYLVAVRWPEKKLV